ncbi:MAG TPA: FimV/HubP family polar landmark protein [Steroidobacteraceae bacterium]|jgi:pilus assembly protein FimV|nr:FimV/HubP family polar landmark protein [Steroidobacteraceae bacterium]
MVAKSVKWALASLVIFPPAAFALGLGDVRLLSALNAPLDAEIEILGATPEELATLKAQIASSELFQRYGLDRPAVLNGVTMTTTKNAAGKEVIRLRTNDPITEPFLTMLVEVNSARNHLVREYDLLLDPPVYAPPGPQVADAPIAAPSTGDSARSGQISRAPATTPSARATEPASSSFASESSSSSAPSSAAAGTTRTVRPGETLSGIASEISGGNAAQSRAWMLAIYQNNPAAFDNNMNVMRSGAVLRIPDNATVAAISPSEAAAEIRRQWSAWRGSGPATADASSSSSERGQLRLVPPSESGSATAGDAALRAENSRLQGRVSELQAQLDESRRLLELKNAEVAQLQARLSAQQSSSPSASTPPPQPEQPAASAQPTPPAETPPAEQPVEQASTEQPAAAAEPAPEAQPNPPPATRPAVAAAPQPEKGGSILDTLIEYWWVGAALVVAALAFFGLRAFRSRQRNEFDDSLSRLAASSAGAAALDRGDFGGSDTQPLRAGAGGAQREAAFLVEESGTHERPRFGAEVAAAPRNVSVPADDTISSETAINLDQGDPLAEADFHMAYGLYDQAADLVRIAISREPNRRDLKLKLLEVFFVWGNKEQFLQTARELAETRDRAQSGEWEKIVIMGKQLAPEDPLFAGSGGGSSSLGGVDLDLEGGQSRVDFDLLGEPVAASSGNDIDLDIGSALGEGSGDSATVTDANLALHEDENFASGGTQTTRQMTQKIRQDEPTVATYSGDFEAPTVEQPQLYAGANQTVRQKVETAMRQGSAAEQTAELAIDDLGLDLSALDTMDQPGIASTQEAPTLVAGLDERSRRIMDEAERRGMRASDPDATAISATGSWNLAGGEDLDQTMPPQRVGSYQNGSGEGADGSETSRLAAVKSSSDLDFNFNDAEEPQSIRMTNGSGASVDLDVGTATVPDTAFTSTQKLNSEDLALPDLEPVTMSEVGTKLDLARAYMDMGDPEGARNILEEVMQEGSVAQKQEAQRLIESLPG